MMRFISKIYRKNFCSRPKQLLLELFDESPDITRGIVLQEVGLPKGKVNIYRWWETELFAFFSKSAAASTGSEVVRDAPIRNSRKCFNELLCFIVASDEPRMANYSGNLRDGVVFSVAWGSPMHIRAVTLQNPTRESTYAKLIQGMKENAWK